MHRVALRQGGFLDLLGSLMLAHDAREVLLPVAGALVAVPAPDDPTSELERFGY